MVVSGTAERVVFVHDRPGDEALLTGGTIARLTAHGAHVVVVFGAPRDGDPADSAGASSAEARAALGVLAVSDWMMLPAASGDDAAAGPDALAASVWDVLAEARATAVVVGSVDERLVVAATSAARSAGVPVFLSSRESDAIGRRRTVIDVSDQIAQKLAAIAAYADRWTVTGHAVRSRCGPTVEAVPVTGTETYLRAPEPAEMAGNGRPGPAARLLTAVLALLAGAAFGVVGTIAHQSVVIIGPVTIPSGLILALVSAVALLAGLRLVLGDRFGVFSCALGLLGTIFLLSLRSAGGSVLVPAGLPGTVWTIVPTVAAALVLAWPRIPARGGSA